MYSLEGRALPLCLEVLLERLGLGEEEMAVLMLYGAGLAVHEEFLFRRGMRGVFLKHDFQWFAGLEARLDCFYRLFGREKLTPDVLSLDPVLTFQRVFSREADKGKLLALRGNDGFLPRYSARSVARGVFPGVELLWHNPRA